jgi:hypothetical protein
MGTFVAILLSIFTSLIAAEILGLGKLLGRWIINKSVERLPQAERERLREELLAHLNELDGFFVRIAHALSFARHAVRLAAELRYEANVQILPRRENVVRKIFEQLTRVCEFKWLSNVLLPAPCYNWLKRASVFFTGSREKSSFSQMVRIGFSIIAVIWTVFKAAPGPTLIDSQDNSTIHSGREIEVKVPNRATEPAAAQPTGAATSPDLVGGVARVADRGEAITHAAQRVNSGLPWNAPVNIGTASPFINSDALLGGRTTVRSLTPLLPDIATFAANINDLTSPRSGESRLLASSLAPFSSQSALDAAPYLNNAALAVVSSPVVNLSALAGGDSRAHAEAYLGTGIRPWGPASDALGAISPQFAGVIPALNNNALLGTSTATITVAELAVGSHLLTRALTQLNEAATIQQTTSLTSNYLNVADGRYLASPAIDRDYLATATLVSGIAPNTLGLNQSMSISRGVPIVEPAFLVGGANTLSSLTPDMNAVISQGSLSSRMSSCAAALGCLEVLGRTAPSCDPTGALPRPLIGISPPPLGGCVCTRL